MVFETYRSKERQKKLYDYVLSSENVMTAELTQA